MHTGPSLRVQLIRLAKANPNLRAQILPVLARFEAGKPADPTENMSPEDRDKWWAEHEKNKDNFKQAYSLGTRSLYLREETAKSIANRPDQAKVSTVAELLKEVLSLIAGTGAVDRDVEALARQEASALVKKALRLRKR